MASGKKQSQQFARQLLELSLVNGAVSPEHVAGVLAYLERTRPANALRPVEISRLAGAITEVLTAAIECGGSTLDDTQYVDVSGRTGEFQHQHLVYGRRDEGCLTCAKSVIRRATVGGRSTFFCPRCQK